jgi:hypothetical protein
MGADLAVWGPDGAERVPLAGTRVSVGKAPGNDIVLRDAAVSRVHFVLEPVGPGWALTDVGSRNGTFLNGERVLGTQILRPSDELRVGSTRLVFGARGPSAQVSETAAALAPPSLTPRERDALVALCAPILRGSTLSEPARVREVAAALVVSESAAKKLLGRLYDKFNLHGEDRRRGRLVAEAISRGAVTRRVTQTSGPVHHTES